MFHNLYNEVHNLHIHSKLNHKNDFLRIYWDKALLEVWSCYGRKHNELDRYNYHNELGNSSIDLNCDQQNMYRPDNWAHIQDWI